MFCFVFVFVFLSHLERFLSKKQSLRPDSRGYKFIQMFQDHMEIVCSFNHVLAFLLFILLKENQGLRQIKYTF